MTWKLVGVAFISGVTVGSTVSKVGKVNCFDNDHHGEKPNALDTWKGQTLYNRMRSRPNWFRPKDE